MAGSFADAAMYQSVLIYYTDAKVMNLINMDSNEIPKKPSILALPLSHRDGIMTTVGYCNGLVCMLHERDDVIVLWNPAMEMFQIVGRYGFCDDHFVFLGLGYDAGGDDFKLVKIVMTTDTGYRTNSMEVYSVNAGAWTKIEINLDFYVEDNSAVTVNGNPYFLAHVGDVDEYCYAEDDPPLANMLVYLDVKLMAFWTVPLPPPYLPDSRKDGLVDWNGSLGYLECATNEAKTESYAKIWLFRGSWSCIETLGPINGTVERFVACTVNGNIVGLRGGKCFVYDRRSESVEEILSVEGQSASICGYTANFQRTLLEQVRRER